MSRHTYRFDAHSTSGLYLAGLHNRGNNAVHHYTEERIADRFGLMCAAFGQPLYKVDRELNIIEE